MKPDWIRRLKCLALLLLTSAGMAWAQSCPLCKLALIHSPEGRRMAKAFNSGILFLLAMPYLVGGGMAFSIFWRRRRPSKIVTK